MPLSHRSRGGLAGIAALAASGVLLLAAACGGSGDGDGQAAANGQNGFTAYAECMSKNGVTLNLPTNRPSGGFPSGRPTTRPSGQPTVRPSGQASGRPGGGMRGGGGLGRPDGVDDATWQKAQEACRSVLPSGGPGGFPGGGGPGGDQGGAATAYRTCLTDHGVTVNGRIEDLDSSDAKTAAALKACAPLRPSAVPSPTSYPSPTS